MENSVNMAHFCDLINFYFMLGLHEEIIELSGWYSDTYVYTEMDFEEHGALMMEEWVWPREVASFTIH